MSIIDDIHSFLNDYFTVLQTQDLMLFDRVFNKHCVLYSQQDGACVALPLAQYRAMLQARQSPAARGCPREETVLMLDVLSPTMVLAKVRLRRFNNIMEDHLNLMLHEGRWQVYAKHFYRAGSA